MYFSIWEGAQLLEAVEGKQGSPDAASKLGQGHIKNQQTDTKERMHITEEKEGEKRDGGEKKHVGEMLLIWGVCLSFYACIMRGN